MARARGGGDRSQSLGRGGPSERCGLTAAATNLCCAEQAILPVGHTIAQDVKRGDSEFVGDGVVGNHFACWTCVCGQVFLEASSWSGVVAHSVECRLIERPLQVGIALFGLRAAPTLDAARLIDAGHNTAVGTERFRGAKAGNLTDLELDGQREDGRNARHRLQQLEASCIDGLGFCNNGALDGVDLLGQPRVALPVLTHFELLQRMSHNDVAVQRNDVLGAPLRRIDAADAHEDTTKRAKLGGALADQVDPTAHDVANGALRLGDNGSARDSTESMQLGKSACIALVGLDARTGNGPQGQRMRERDAVAVFDQAIGEPIPVEGALDDDVHRAAEACEQSSH